MATGIVALAGKHHFATGHVRRAVHVLSAFFVKRKTSNDFPAGSGSMRLVSSASPPTRAAVTSASASTNRNADASERKTVKLVSVTAGLEGEGV
jgi:hypothetical protein